MILRTVDTGKTLYALASSKKGFLCSLSARNITTEPHCLLDHHMPAFPAENNCRKQNVRKIDKPNMKH